MADPVLRVGLVGTSFGGSVQGARVRLLEGVQLVALASAHLERARALATATGIPTRSMLPVNTRDPDVVGSPTTPMPMMSV
jgi:predicted dehydrogenase